MRLDDIKKHADKVMKLDRRYFARLTDKKNVRMDIAGAELKGGGRKEEDSI